MNVPVLTASWQRHVTERRIAKTPHEHFMRVVNDELAKFQRKELAFQFTE